MALEHSIKNKHYIFCYDALEEDVKKVKREQKSKPDT
jgi:hypothetical protein